MGLIDFISLRDISILAEASQMFGRVPFPTGSLRWGLVATVPAMSPTHRNAAGLASYLMGNTGFKACFTLEREKSDQRANRLVNLPVERYKWTGMVLGPGHVL